MADVWDQFARAPAQAASPMASADASAGQTGEPYLKALDKPVADQVKAMVEGRMAPPSSFALKTPYWQMMLEHASQYEPGFDFTQWGQRQATRKEFNAGGPNSPAGNITAGNTAIQHLSQLSDAAEKLGNWGGIPLVNHLANQIKNSVSSASGNPEVTNFETIRDKYVEEATKFYRGIGGNESDIQRDIKTLSTANSPAQLREGIATQAHLMESKISALQERWKRAMGPNAGEFPIVHDISRNGLDKIMTRAAGKNDAAAPTAPAFSEGMTATNPQTGQRVVFKGGQWSPLQ